MSARTAARRASVPLAAAVVLALAPAARADEPDDEGCGLLVGPAEELCREEPGSEGGGGGAPDPSDPLSSMDPLKALADGFASAAAWTVDQLSNAVKITGDVDFTSGAFVRTYAIVFAASTFLTLLLWLWAVTKRAVRGAPLIRAMGEAVGLLWLAVIASAFTPLILYTVVGMVDSITDVLAGGDQGSKFFDSFSAALRKEDTSEGAGGPIVRILLSMVSILAAGVVWLELVVRTALLYVGALLGLLVYSGLVDKDLWGRVRRWVGLMVAIIMVKPIIVIVLMLASALAGGNPDESPVSAIVSGLSIIIIAVFASALLFRLIPGMGDDIVAARRDSYDPASKQSVALVTRPAATMRQGISTHAARDDASRPSQPPAQSASASNASSGISAHASRPARQPDVPRQAPRSDDARR
ncbi:hypothetical protein ACGFMO_37310 [Streptomyces niveus]|uniref:hypothetical protein n=1 Tax=Streptomyces niveus TaxID=193462 RepID=UPI00371BDDCE